MAHRTGTRLECEKCGAQAVLTVTGSGAGQIRCCGEAMKEK